MLDGLRQSDQTTRASRADGEVGTLEVEMVSSLGGHRWRQCRPVSSVEAILVIRFRGCINS